MLELLILLLGLLFVRVCTRCISYYVGSEFLLACLLARSYTLYIILLTGTTPIERNALKETVVFRTRQFISKPIREKRNYTQRVSQSVSLIAVSRRRCCCCCCYVRKDLKFKRRVATVSLYANLLLKIRSCFFTSFLQRNHRFVKRTPAVLEKNF